MRNSAASAGRGRTAVGAAVLWGLLAWLAATAPAAALQAAPLTPASATLRVTGQAVSTDGPARARVAVLLPALPVGVTPAVEAAVVALAESDDDGRFTLELAVPVRGGSTLRDVHVLVQRAGCVTARHEQRARLRPDAVAEVDLAWVGLAPEGVLRGRVVDPDGEPVPGVALRRLDVDDAELLDLAARRLPPEFSAWALGRSDAQGRWELRGLETAPVATDLALELRHLAFVERRAAFAPVASGETRELGDVVLDPGRRAGGRVTDTDGAPIPGAALYLVHAQPPRRHPRGRAVRDQRFLWPDASAFATTGADGRYLLGGLTPEIDALFVAADGYEPAPAPFATDAHVVLQREARLHLKAYDAWTRAPLPATRVEARRLTETLGHHALLPVPVVTGDGVTSVHRAGALGLRLELEQPGYVPRSLAVAALAPGEESTLHLAFEPEARLHGRLLDAQGEPQPLCSVWLTLTRAARTAESVAHDPAHSADLGRSTLHVEARTDHRGGFEFGALPAGDAELVAYGSHPPTMTTSRSLTLRAGRTHELTLRFDGTLLPVVKPGASPRRPLPPPERTGNAALSVTILSELLCGTLPRGASTLYVARLTPLDGAGSPQSERAIEEPIHQCGVTLQGLDAGRYRLTIVSQAHRLHRSDPEAALHALAGEPLPVDVTLRAHETRTLTLQLPGL